MERRGTLLNQSEFFFETLLRSIQLARTGFAQERDPIVKQNQNWERTGVPARAAPVVIRGSVDL